MNKDTVHFKIKYIFFYFLFALNITNVYFFVLRAWRNREVLNYVDVNYKGYLNITEFFMGYVTGWLFLFILSMFFSLEYIATKPVKAFILQIAPLTFYIIFFTYCVNRYMNG